MLGKYFFPNNDSEISKRPAKNLSPNQSICLVNVAIDDQMVDDVMNLNAIV